MKRHEYIAFQKSLPISNEQNNCAMVDVTYKCSASCRHCYSDLGDHRPILEVMKEIEECPQERIILTGGEPLECPDLDDILEMCRVLGKRPSVLTNGGLLTQNRLEELCLHGLDIIDGLPQVAVSLQFPGYNKTHEAALANLKTICVDNISFTVENTAQVSQAKWLANELRGHYRAVCIRTAWHPNRFPMVDAYEVVQALGGTLLDIPAPYAERSASVEADGIHYKVISWPNRQEYDANVFEGKGIWYKGKNVVTTLCGK